jgi:hypothetical protein
MDFDTAQDLTCEVSRVADELRGIRVALIAGLLADDRRAAPLLIEWAERVADGKPVFVTDP